jgi:hypothetical protein
VDINGAGVDSRVVEAVRRFSTDAPATVQATLVDLDRSRPASSLVRSVVAARAVPMAGGGSLRGDTFVGARPGTTLVFRLELDPRVATPTAQERQFPLRIVFTADGSVGLSQQDLVLTVPALGGVACARDGG